MINQTLNKDSVSFWIKSANNRAIASADLTRIDAPDLGKSVFYFSRLIKPEGFNPANAAILLMNAIATWADREKITILDEVSPYGKMNLNKLIRFNKLWGFKLVPDTDNVMVRTPKEE